MATPLDPSIPPADGRCPWNKMPAEIQEMVYDLAYVPAGKLHPLHKAEWEEKEHLRQMKEKSSFQPRPFPAPFFVERLLVSKGWYATSLKYFYSHAHFDFQDKYEYLRFFDKNGEPGPLLQTITTFSTRLDYSFIHMMGFDKFPSARRLELGLRTNFFRQSLEKDIETDVWTEDDFSAYEQTNELLRQICGISSIIITGLGNWEDLLWARSPKATTTFEANIKTLEQMANSLSKCPRPTWEHKLQCLSPYPSPDYDFVPSSPVGAYALQEESTRKPLQDHEIPEDEHKFRDLMFTRGSDLFDWVQAAKRKMGGGDYWATK